MTKYAVFFRFKGETIKSLIDRPSDRAAMVSALCESGGGRMESYYLMFGDWDGFVIADMPDSAAAAALSLAVSASGSFASLETHELVEPAALQEILAKAGSLTYSPPGT